MKKMKVFLMVATFLMAMAFVVGADLTQNLKGSVDINVNDEMQKEKAYSAQEVADIGSKEAERQYRAELYNDAFEEIHRIQGLGNAKMKEAITALKAIE